MPQLNFVLPHWMYWGVLLLFPFIAMYLVARQKRLGEPTGPSLFVAYLFWVCAGFSGLHRFYLRNAWGFVFIPVFLGICTSTTISATGWRMSRALARPMNRPTCRRIVFGPTPA